VNQQSIEPYIVFSVAGTSYALRSAEVLHVEMIEQVTRVPNAAPFVDGVVFSRGQVVPAVNLRVRFGFDRVPYDLKTRLIVVQHAGRSVGLVADRSREFVALAAATIQPPQESLAGSSGVYVQGIAALNDRLLFVLRLEHLLNFSEPLIAA
jgi:purine-binding chemotaxis protein CheW